MPSIASQSSGVETGLTIQPIIVVSIFFSIPSVPANQRPENLVLVLSGKAPSLKSPLSFRYV